MFWNKQTILLALVLALVLIAEVANADYLFGPATNLGPTVNSSTSDTHPSIANDGLSLFFRSNRPGGYGGHDIWVTTRATTNDDWGIPVNLGPTINSSARDSGPGISADGLSLFFDSVLPGGHGGEDIWVSTRPTHSDPWGKPVNLGPTVNGSYRDGAASISHDGLELYFNDFGSGPFRPGGSGGGDLWVATRATQDEPWAAPVNLGPTVNGPTFDASANISADGLALFFYSRRPGDDFDIWLSRRTTKDDPWGAPVNLGPPFNTSDNDVHPSISADGSTLYFASNRPGGSGGSDLWQVSIIPIIDLNGDGLVDAADMRIVVDHWGTDEPLCDIGPMPWGDGIVDAGDLLVLSEHMIENAQDSTWSTYDIWRVEVDFNADGAVDTMDIHELLDHWGRTDSSSYDVAPPPMGDGVVDAADLVVMAEHMIENAFAADPNQALMAHWALDETEGIVASDGVSGNADIVMGNALWLPAGGKVGGALELDGVDDCLISTFGLNPADPGMSSGLSIFAWIKGGAPGQAIISEPMGSNLLMVDAAGKLMTELASVDRTPLVSETVITDGQWHRIGLGWDGSQRMLCADGVIVAEDTQDGLAASNSGLYIGVANDYGAGTFFSGLIDDVRIYSRAIRP